MDKDDQRSQIIEARTRQVTESKEQLQIAKNKIAYEIAKAMQGKELPAMVRTFLDDAWKDVMLVAYLRADKEPQQWENSLSVVGRLIRSVIPSEDGLERSRILKDIPRLIKDIRLGLENISFDPHKMSALFKDLEACHVTALNGTAKPQDGPTSSKAHQAHQPQTAAHREPLGELVKDAAMAAEIETMAGNLPDPDASGSVGPSPDSALSPATPGQIEEIVMGSPPAGEPADEIHDEFTSQAKCLEIGQWILFKNNGNEDVRAKLSWKSPLTPLYVFVDRKGVKIEEKTLQGLAVELRRGEATILENANVPVMDRALAAMMRTLKTSQQQESASV